MYTTKTGLYMSLLPAIPIGLESMKVASPSNMLIPSVSIKVPINHGVSLPSNFTAHIFEPGSNKYHDLPNPKINVFN